MGAVTAPDMVWWKGAAGAAVPLGLGPGRDAAYDSSSRPSVFSRAAVKRRPAFSQLAMFQKALT